MTDISSYPASDYADLVRELHQAADEHDRGHGPLHAAAANAIDHLMTLIRLMQPGAAAQAEKNPQTAFNLGFRAAGGGCHLPPSAEALFQSWLRDGASQAGREPEEEIPAAIPAQAPMHADIAQMIDAGWKTGKSSSEVAEEILREFDASTVPSTLRQCPICARRVASPCETLAIATSCPLSSTDRGTP